MNNPTPRWKVRRWRLKDGSLPTHVVSWHVYDETGRLSQEFESWDEAMLWATSIAAHVEWWLECETRQR